MALETIANIRELVYEYLRVNTQGAYGTFLANQRYPSAYIDDEIYAADRYITRLLLDNGQQTYFTDIYQTGVSSVPMDIPENAYIISVQRDSNEQFMVELTEDQYETMSEGGIFDTATYGEYYYIKNGQIFSWLGANILLTYIVLSNTADIHVPSGFAKIVAMRAAATMLMNREDKPEHSKFLMNEFEREIAPYMTQYKNTQVKVEN